MTYLKQITYSFLEICISLLVLSFIYYMDFISIKTYSLLKLISILVIIGIHSFKLGRIKQKKGYREGIKFALVYITLFLLISLFLKQFQLKVLFYYFLIISSSILGGIIGNYQKNK